MPAVEMGKYENNGNAKRKKKSQKGPQASLKQKVRVRDKIVPFKSRRK